MRFVKAAVILSVCLFGGIRATEVDDDEDWSEFEVTDDDSGDIDSDSAEEAASFEGDTTLAETVDEKLSEPERKLRMTICIGVTREKFAIDNLLEQSEKLAELTGMSKEQVANNMQLNMVKNCYLNFDEKRDFLELTSGDPATFKEATSRVLAPPASEVEAEGKTTTLLKRQWDLIRDVIETEQKASSDKKKDDDDPYSEFSNFGRMELIGSKMSSFQKFLYFVSVFGAVFGGGYLLVKKLIGYEIEKNQKRVSKKLQKKD